MPTRQKTYELKNESLKNVLNYIEKETRRQKNRNKKIDIVIKAFAEVAKHNILHYDKSAKAQLLKNKFLQIYPFKFDLRYSVKYIFDTIKDIFNAKMEHLERNKIFKIFFKEMSIMLRSGILFIPALEIVKCHISSKRFKEVLERIIYDLKANGASFTKSIQRFPNYFSKIYVCIIESGEKTCNLPIVFEEIAQLEEKGEYLRNKLKNAMIYPMFVFLFSIIMLFIIAKMLIPAILSLANGFQIKGVAKIVVFMADIFSRPQAAYALFILILSGVTVFYLYIKTPEGKYAWDKFKINIPVLGDALIKVHVINFCIILHVLHKSGISIAASTRILSDVFENSYIKSQLNKIIFPRVNSGYQLSLALKELGFFPPVALQLMSAGEESGRLVELLKKVIDIYKFEVEDSLIRLSNILEPVIIVAFGALVCFIAIISMLPIYQVVSSM